MRNGTGSFVEVHRKTLLKCKSSYVGPKFMKKLSYNANIVIVDNCLTIM